MHFITPILHLTIGKGNNVLDNYIIKLQAAAPEGYTLTSIVLQRKEKFKPWMHNCMQNTSGRNSI
jgi:hypothetical protein